MQWCDYNKRFDWNENIFAFSRPTTTLTILFISKAQIVCGKTRKYMAVVAAIKYGTCYMCFFLLKCHYSCVLLIFSQPYNVDEDDDERWWRQWRASTSTGAPTAQTTNEQYAKLRKTRKLFDFCYFSTWTKMSMDWNCECNAVFVCTRASRRLWHFYSMFAGKNRVIALFSLVCIFYDKN